MRKRTRRVAAIAALAVAVVVASMTLIQGAQAAGTVTVNGKSRTLDGVNVTRQTNYLVEYTPAKGARTGTNQYGTEVSVVGGKVTAVKTNVGNMAIPSNGFVLSGHGSSEDWLLTNAKVGATVVIGSGSSPPPTTQPPSSGADYVTLGTSSHKIDGTNIARQTDYLVRYTPAKGATTGTNQWGFEVAVVNGKVDKVASNVGNMTIPSNGYVLSGHGTSDDWLAAHASPGMDVTLGTGSVPTTPPKTGALLPDLGVQKLQGSFSIQHPTSGAFAGRKLLKFDGVTQNIGDGPFELKGHRSTSSSTDWVATQMIHNSDGSTTPTAAPGATFYFAGDGHNHWHVKDIDSYELFNSAGTKLRDGEKHGFCFEDNTIYRGTFPIGGERPASPVYENATSCGVGQPQATDITHGLSVGWGDTYPSSLPDQAIDITGIPDGTYIVSITADWDHWFKESNESNNQASSKIKIAGDTVTLVSVINGL